MKEYALEVKALRVLDSAKGREQTECALRFVELVKRRIGVLSREVSSMAIRRAIELGNGSFYRKAFVACQHRTTRPWP